MSGKNGTNGVGGGKQQPKSGLIRSKGGTSPIVIGYRKITKRPIYQRVRNFVGIRQTILNIAIKAFDLIDELCFEEENLVVEEGEQEVVYWAIEVEDPWGINPTGELQARRLADKPGCGVYTEVIRIVDEKKEKEEAARQAADSDRPSAPALPPHVLMAVRRPEQNAIRERMRAQLRKDGYDPEPAPVPAPPIQPTARAEVLPPKAQALRERMQEQLARDGHFDPQAGPAEPAPAPPPPLPRNGNSRDLLPPTPGA